MPDLVERFAKITNINYFGLHTKRYSLSHSLDFSDFSILLPDPINPTNFGFSGLFSFSPFLFCGYTFGLLVFNGSTARIKRLPIPPLSSFETPLVDSSARSRKTGIRSKSGQNRRSRIYRKNFTIAGNVTNEFLLIL